MILLDWKNAINAISPTFKTKSTNIWVLARDGFYKQETGEYATPYIMFEYLSTDNKWMRMDETRIDKDHQICFTMPPNTLMRIVKSGNTGTNVTVQDDLDDE